MRGSRSFSAMPTPASVPPEPTALTKPSMRPCVSRVDLRSGRLVMAATIGDIVELVRPDRPVRLRLRKDISESAGIFHVIVRVGIGDRRHFDELGADEAQHVLLFLRLRVGDDDDAAKSQRRGDHADADAGIAGGALDDDAAGAQRAARDRVADDRQRGAVLDRTAGVHELGLAQNRAAGRLGGRPELDQRRIADRFDDGGAERHRDLFFSNTLSEAAAPDKNARGGAATADVRSSPGATTSSKYNV